MKIGLLADIHANKHALEAVLTDKHIKDVDQWWFLGDLVGRGPDPISPLDWLLSHVEEENWVPGNHEAMLADQLGYFALQRVDLATQLTINKQRDIPKMQSWIKSELLSRFQNKKLTKVLNHISNTLAIISHASCNDPLGTNNGNNGYIYAWDERTYKPEFENLKSRNATNQLIIKCFGHTHVPTLISASRNSNNYEPYFVRPFQRYELVSEQLWLINPGSVGTPRDLDPRASYAIVDLGIMKPSVTFYRVSYKLSNVRKDLKALEKKTNYPETIYEKYFQSAIPDPLTPKEWLKHYQAMSLVTENEKQ